MVDKPVPRKLSRPIVIAGVATAIGVATWVFVKPNNDPVYFPREIDASTIDAPAIDAPPADAAPDAPPEEWVRTTIASHAVCQGADGVNAKDYDGDGDIDFTTACEQGGKIIVATRTGCGTFTVSTMPAPATGQGAVVLPEDARFGDVDGDGHDDVVEGESGSAKVRYYKWTAPLTWNQPVILAATQKYMQVAVHSPGVLFAGGYSTNAKVVRITAPPPYTTWTTTVLSNLNWAKCLEIHGDDVFVCDYLGGLRGPRWIRNATIGTGTVETSLSSDYYTLRGAVVGDQVVTAIGTADGESSGATLKIVGGATAVFPERFGRAQAVTLCDINNDGLQDMVVTASHATSPVTDKVESDTDFLQEGVQPPDVSSVVWLEGPDFVIRHEVSGPYGIKHDNAVCVDIDCDGDLDIATTEEKELGLIWYKNPLNQTVLPLLPVMIVLLLRRPRRWRR